MTTPSHAVTLAEAAALPAGTVVTIDEAVIINPILMTEAGIDLIQIRDDTRAASVFAGSTGQSMANFLSGLQTGDVVSFTATTANYQGLFELTGPLSTASIVPAPQVGTNLSPVPVSPQDFDDFSSTAESLESRYVSLQGIELFYGSPNLNQQATAGAPVAGQAFQADTTYVARDSEGKETIVWTRSQASVDSLNAHFGTIPAGPFDLPGIFLHAFDRGNPPPGTAGINYLLNPVVIAMPGDLNGDGFVGVDDLDIVLGNWNLAVTPGDLQGGDPSGDGFVGIEDLDTVLGWWNRGLPPAADVAAKLPEPASLFIALVIAAPLLRPGRTG